MKNMQIKPLIAPTRQIMKIGVKNYDWHELFPKGNINFILFHVHKKLEYFIVLGISNLKCLSSIQSRVMLVQSRLFGLP